MLATKQGDKAWKANAVAAIAASSTLALQSGQEASYMVLFKPRLDAKCWPQRFLQVHSASDQLHLWLQKMCSCQGIAASRQEAPARQVLNLHSVSEEIFEIPRRLVAERPGANPLARC